MQAKTLLIEMPEEFWRLAEIFTASQKQQPYPVTKIIETAIQLRLAIELQTLSICTPTRAIKVAQAMSSESKCIEFIEALQKQKGELNEHQP